MSINCNTIIDQADCVYDQLICSPRDQSAAIVIGLLACLVNATNGGSGLIPADAEWTTISSPPTIDLTTGYSEILAPVPGSTYVLRYLNFGNANGVPGIIAFSTGSNFLYPAYTLPGSIWATRFNEGQELILGDNVGFGLVSSLDTNDIVTFSIEYTLVAI